MKNKIVMGIAAIIIAGASFFGGMKYQQSKSPTGFANLTPAERQQRVQQMGDNGGAIFRNGNGRIGGGGIIAGEVLSIGNGSLTVKMQDDSTKIILLSGSTKISKTVDGVSSDVSTGKSVAVTGTANSDGSVTAQSIQIRPNIPSPSPTPTK